MRVYSVPGRYRAALAAAVNEAVEQIRRDIFRRQNGHAALIPDSMISDTPAPDAIVAIDSVVVVGDANDSVADAITKARAAAREERRRRHA